LANAKTITKQNVIFLKLTSTCFENGLSDISFYEVKNWSAQNLRDLSEAESRDSEKSNVKIYPNPAQNELKIDITLMKNSNVEINFISQNGQKKKVFSESQLAKGLQLLSINVSSFKNGYYLTELIIDGIIIYQPIIILK